MKKMIKNSKKIKRNILILQTKKINLKIQINNLRMVIQRIKIINKFKNK